MDPALKELINESVDWATRKFWLTQWRRDAAEFGEQVANALCWMTVEANL